MEEKTLEELNDEYKNLVEKVKQIKIELEGAIKRKESADANYESASADFATKKDTYDALEAGIQKIENSGFSSALVEKMREEIEVAKKAMEDAELVLKVREKEQEDAKSNFERIETDSKRESSRLDVILISFGANKTINEAITNEIEIDYSEMIEKKQKEKAEIDELKTKINSDSKIQEQVGELDGLLKRFNELKKNVTPENAAELAELGKQIKTQRTAIRRRMRTLGIKGGKISAEEIDRMTADKDEQGRIVIEELERRTSVADAEIVKIGEEKKALLEKLAMSLEMGQQSNEDQKKYQELKDEIDRLNAEKDTLEKEQDARKRNLEDIEKQRTKLKAEMDSLEDKPQDTAKISTLQQEKAAIEAESVPKIDNPKKSEIRKQIEDLKVKKKSGSEADVETEEYKKAKQAYDSATRKLEMEKERPTIYLAAETDEIIDNPKYRETYAKLVATQNKQEQMINSIFAKDPELKTVYDDYIAAMKQEKDINDELLGISGTVCNKKEELVAQYVSDDMYEGLRDNATPEGKAFEEYRKAELEVRKAMLELQKDPSDENINALLEAKDKLGTVTESLQSALSDVAGTTTYPSPKAIHRYLLGKLREEYDDYSFDALDEAYDLNCAERRIAILEAQTPKTDRESVAKLRESSKGLEDMLNSILSGKEMTDKELADCIALHRENLESFEDADRVKSILRGSDIATPNTRFSFIRKIVSRFTIPKVDERYVFSKNEAPLAKDEYETAYERQSELQDELQEAKEQTKKSQKEYTKKFKEVSTDEEWKSVQDQSREIQRLNSELRSIPQKINKTKLEELTAEVKKAEEAMNKTPRYNSTVDTKAIDAQITALTAQFNSEPDKIEDPVKAEDKKRRIAAKAAEIDEAKKKTDNPRKAEIDALLGQLDAQEIEERTKIEEGSNKLSGIVGSLREKCGLLSVLDVARRKVMNIIHIKDANRMLDRRSGRIAEDLVNATRTQRTENDEHDER